MPTLTLTPLFDVPGPDHPSDLTVQRESKGTTEPEFLEPVPVYPAFLSAAGLNSPHGSYTRITLRALRNTGVPSSSPSLLSLVASLTARSFRSSCSRTTSLTCSLSLPSEIRHRACRRQLLGRLSNLCSFANSQKYLVIDIPLCY